MLPRNQLAHISREMLHRGERLVLTNGCFDLLHVGHVRYLQRARALGDVLAVGVNSDDSVRRLKGDLRPLIPQDERAEILAALACVDLVTVFGEDTAAQLVADIHPAVYVKGGDYSSEPSSSSFPIEGHIVLQYGGKVQIIDFVPGRSTTEIVERLRKG